FFDEPSRSHFPTHFPEREFDQKTDYRAEKREHLRGRNNVTLCRSPTRDDDTRQIKNQLKEKRQQEFLRRRSMSPELKCGKCSRQRKPSPQTFSFLNHSSRSRSETLHPNTPSSPSANGHRGMILTPESRITEYPTKWVNDALTLSGLLLPVVSKICIPAPLISLSSRPHYGQNQKHPSGKREYVGQIFCRNLFCCWLCTQEALWREEALKNKLALLKEIAANLINTSDLLWTSRCNEDLLRNKIKVLEAQLQVCLQKFPKDGVKKLMLQMEKQRGTYEERALAALQKMTQEKSEALSKAETLQVKLQISKLGSFVSEPIFIRTSTLQQIFLKITYIFCKQEALSAAQAEVQRWENSKLEEELRHTQEKLQLKEKEVT
uniref:TRAF3 interacting protein 3 n=1 Tax=Nothobranchius furzeri TaxID=105023 RepID=A0A8C6PRS1_NOTFU